MDKLLGPQEESKEYSWSREAYDWDPHRASIEARGGKCSSIALLRLLQVRLITDALPLLKNLAEYLIILSGRQVRKGAKRVNRKILCQVRRDASYSAVHPSCPCNLFR